MEMALIFYIKDGERELSIIFSTFWQHMNGKRKLNKKCELKPPQPLLQQCDHAFKSFMLVIQMASELTNKIISMQPGQIEICTLFPFDNLFIQILFPIYFSAILTSYVCPSPRLGWPHFVSASHFSTFLIAKEPFLWPHKILHVMWKFLKTKGQRIQK